MKKSPASSNTHSLDMGVLFLLVFANYWSLDMEKSSLVLSCWAMKTIPLDMSSSTLEQS